MPSGPPDAPGEGSGAIEEYASLEAIMSRASGENFPVALRVLPASLQQHLQAIYGYARLVDNLGDEYPGDRSAALGWMESQLDALFAGTASHPVFEQLAPTVARFQIPRTPFDSLLEANRLDQRKKSYADWDELMAYCELSANPVGHLVLAVFESATAARLEASDAVCSGLQVLEHLQDVAEDARAGRVYLPADDMERFGCATSDLTALVAGPALRRLVEHQVDRARELIERGRWLAGSLRGYARLSIAGFVAGGLSGLDAIEAAGFEVLGGTRQAGSWQLLRRFLPLYAGAMARRGKDLT